MASSKKFSKVTINGVTVLDSSSTELKVRRWSVSKTNNDFISSGVIITLKSITTLVTPIVGQTVEIFEGFTTSTDTKRFSGFISKIDKTVAGLKLEIKDKLWEAVRKEVTKEYDSSTGVEAGKISEIFKDLINSFTTLTANNTSVQDSGTTLIITKFRCNHVDVFERLQALANALNWQFYYKASSDLVFFEPKGFTKNVNVITIGASGDVRKPPKWKRNLETVINNIELHGANILVSKRENFLGDNSTLSFPLIHNPQDVKVLVDSDEKQGGITDETSSFDYTVDPVLPGIVFASSSTPGSSALIQIDYHYFVPAPVIVDDQDSIDTYGETKVTFIISDITNVADAEQRAFNLLEIMKNPAITTEFEVKPTLVDSYALDRGQEIRVDDNLNDEDELVIVKKIVFKWPEPQVKLFVGDRGTELQDFDFNAASRVKRLEEEVFKNPDDLLHAKALGYEYTQLLESLTIEASEINDSFILNHPQNGFLFENSEMTQLDGFEDTTLWTEGTGETMVITSDTDLTHFWIGTQGSKFTWSNSSGTGIAQNTNSKGNISAITGVAQGSPTKGTAGVWFFSTTSTSVNQLFLRIGSSGSDFTQVIGTLRATFSSLSNNKRFYYVFDLSAGNTTGTPDWTNVDFIELRWGIVASGNITFDFLTASESSKIGANWLNERFTLISTETIT